MARYYLALSRRLTDMTRSRGNDHDNSPFHISVFDTGFACFLAALDDSQHDHERMRIFSAATGAGKTTCGMAYIAGLIESAEAFEAERGHQPSALIVVEQKTKANVMYREMVELLGKKRVAVYTNDHDREHENKSPEELRKDNNRTEQNPAAFFYREELADYPVAIVTANFFRNGGRGDETGIDLATLMRDERRRDFVLVDEQIDEVETFPVVCADIAATHKAIQERVKLKHRHAKDALDAITPLKIFAENKDRLRTPLETLAAEEGLEWFRSEAADKFVYGDPDKHTKAMDSIAQKVFEFARCYRIGYAIISRNKVGKNKWETIYTGYKPDMKCVPGTMVLDASAAVDGVAQLSPWRVQAEVPRVDYSNLTIIAVPEFDKEGRESNFYKFSKNRVRMASFARGVITKYLKPGDKVLVACKQALIPEFTDWRPSDERYKASEYRNGGDGGYIVDVDGVRCAVTHYGDGVGSNDWKEAGTVFLLDNFWIPKREAIAKALGLMRKPAEGQGLSKSLATNHPAVIAVLEGHALRQILQMTGRGMVRNLDHSGRCGPMTVIYSGDIDLLRDNLQAMFHGAKLDDRTGWKPRNITQRILALLDGLSDDVVELTADGVAAVLDAGLWKGISKLVSSDADLAHVGWEFIKGKRGNGSRPAVFRRLRPGASVFPMAA